MHINIDKGFSYEEISNSAFDELIKSGQYTEVSQDELKEFVKAMEAGNNVLVPQDLEGVKVVHKNGNKSMKVIKRRRFGKTIKDVAASTGSIC